MKIPRHPRPIVAAAVLAAASSLSAATVTWTGATNGTWDTATGNWTGGSPTASQFVNGDAAVFDDTGSNTTVSLVSGLTPGAIVVNNSTKNYTFQTNGFTGTTLTKQGTGTLTLANPNAYTGGTTISAGTVQLNTAGSAGTGTITLNDASTGSNNTTLNLSAGATTYGNVIHVANQGAGTTTIAYTATTSGAPLMTTGSIILDKATTFSATSFVSGGALQWGGRLTGGGQLTIVAGSAANNSRILLNQNGVDLNASTFTGDVVIGDGIADSVVEIRSALNSGKNNVTVSANAFLQLVYNTTSIINGLNGTGTVRGTAFGGAATLTVGNGNGNGNFLGAIIDNSGVITFVKAGTGTQTLAGANTYTGTTTVNGGTLNLTGSLTSAVTVNNGAFLSGTGATTGNITFNAGSGIVLNASGSVQGAAVSFAGATNVYVADAPTGSSVIREVIRYTGADPGTANLSAASNYRAGSYTDNAGKISLTYTAESKTFDTTGTGVWDTGSSPNWTGGSDNKFYWGDAVTFGAASGGTITVSAGVAPSSTTVSTSNTLMFTGGAINGAGSLTMNGTGTLTLNAANGYTGGTTVSAGTLQLNVANAAGTGTITLNDASTGASNTTLNLSAGATTYGNTIRVANQGTGTTTIAYTATTSGQPIMTTSSIIVDKAATFSATSYSGSNAALQWVGTLTGSGPLTIVSGSNAGGSRLVLNNGSANLNASAFTGDVIIGDGIADNVVEIRNAFSSGQNNVTVSANAFLQLAWGTLSGNTIINGLNGTGTVRGGSGTSATTLTVGGNNGGGDFTGAIIDNGMVLTLVKAGTGTQTLGGANNYSGTTTVNGGTLRIAGTGVLGNGSYTGAITVGTGATLRYSSSSDQTLSGVIGGGGAFVKDTAGSTLTFSGANTYTGGTAVSAGTLVLATGGRILVKTGDVTIASGATLAMGGGTLKLGVVTATLANSGTLSGSGVLDLASLFDNYNDKASGAYQLITGSGTNTATFTVQGYDTGVWNSVVFNGVNGTLVFTAVPEPSTYGLLGAGTLAGLAFVRRRRRAAGAGSCD